MRRFSGFFFFSVSECSGDRSCDCGWGRVFDSTVVMSLSGDMMVVPVRLRFVQIFITQGSGVSG